jgi:hypothetical protein
MDLNSYRLPPILPQCSDKLEVRLPSIVVRQLPWGTLAEYMNSEVYNVMVQELSVALREGHYLEVSDKITGSQPIEEQLSVFLRWNIRWIANQAVKDKQREKSGHTWARAQWGAEQVVYLIYI